MKAIFHTKYGQFHWDEFDSTTPDQLSDLVAGVAAGEGKYLQLRNTKTCKTLTLSRDVVIDCVVEILP